VRTNVAIDALREAMATMQADGLTPNAIILHPSIDAETQEALQAALDAMDEDNAKAEAWHRFERLVRREEPLYERAALRLFELERENVARRIVKSVPQVKADTLDDPYVEAALLRIAADYAPGGIYHTAWLDRYRALIAQTMRLGGRDVSARIGLSFTLDNPRARAAVLNRVNKLTGSVTETTLARVRDTVRGAMREGVGVSEIATRIREDAFGGAVTRSRAQTIARTEAVGAMNEGSFTAATQSDVMQSKRWLDQSDGRVRDSHRQAASDGWIGISERFSNGLLYPHEPEAHADEVIQCRCSAQFSDLTPAEANARP
jgi:hypothetical protein